jgi:hypothetical protein
MIQRTQRWGFGRGVLVGVAVVAGVWAAWWGYQHLMAAGQVNAQYGDIASIRIHGVPQGEPGPGLVFTPAGVGNTLPLDLVESQLPLPLPGPSRQPIGCNHGGDLTVRLRSGRTITYGPCAWPWQISQLWGAMEGIANLVGTDPSTTHLRREITTACNTRPHLCGT